MVGFVVQWSTRFEAQMRVTRGAYNFTGNMVSDVENVVILSISFTDRTSERACVTKLLRRDDLRRAWRD